MALLVALALFVAQAINFTMLLRERRAFRYSQVIVPAVTRLVDTSERLAAPPQADRQRERRRGPQGGSRVQITTANPISGGERRGDLEEDFHQSLREAGLRPKQLIVTVQRIGPDHPLPGLSVNRAERLRRAGGELRVALQLPDGHWLSLHTSWPRTERRLVWQLAGQTLILYIVVLIPLLLAGRRIARPLRTLAQSARSFRPGDGASPLEERGPRDVRAVIAAYNHLRQRVTAMLDEKDRMLGAIGHDLRTPLAALRVRIESVEDDDDRNRMADTIDEMNRTLEDILSLARLGRPSESATDVDLSALIDAVVEDFRDLDHDVQFEEAPRLRMHLRSALMRRAVRNLIENAVKYAGGAEVRLVPGAGQVRIEVADRGPGIPQDKLAAVFAPFTRLETSRNRETGGIGLGLALAHAIVSDAGGTISLTNREGGGLLATITLPRTAA
ncbi:sensor histidine kinase [Sphingomonas xinjiangensis]|uniref:histidine kinase n=1 Tax=Sphingomonas xinjiangensis TaxID=643568 RepID=A0A840YJG8_9SPHN|nr:ATP-binding protein [Sphingomonas xinjiangensis]MBB5709016.1 signal transduction histidine kinase [Sphingomonas xinjiangensis]